MTFSSTNIIQKNQITKPYLLTKDELNSLGEDINLVGYDFLKTLPESIDENFVNFKFNNPSSPRLLNYVEPYNIAGINYTLFYTEVNSGLKVNDKVFIINGAYDSNLLIQQDKYKKGRDGYKVIFVDECRIVLDIEFKGWLPANELSTRQENFDDFIKVYYIKDENDFIHVNRQITTRNNKFDYKFNKNQNNIIFSNINFGQISNTWGENNGLNNIGFSIKNNLSSWINISNDFMLGSYSIAATNSNNKIIILNGSFTYSYADGRTAEFKEDSVYNWDPVLLSWQVNIKHENNNPAIITKSNFRQGQFDGRFNSGVYGTSEKRITWNSLTATWNSGTLLNTTWQTGIINSLYSQKTSYFAEFESSLTASLPYQKVNNPDNNGYGYNFIINSDIQNAVLNNGNVTNSILGASASLYQIVEDYLKTGTIDLSKFSATSSLVVKKALFDNCKFINANIENTEIRNSRAENSRFNKVKSVNSHYKSSLFLNSNYISDNIIKVLDYDEFTFSSDNFSATHKVYKFYINKRSYEKFKLKDSFYIKGIKINNNSGELLNFFDTKFKIGPYKEYIDYDLNDGNGFIKLSVEYNAFISTPAENQYKYSVSGTNTLFNALDKDYYSVDIFVKQKFDNYNINYSLDFKNSLDFSNAYIMNSDFESGVFENSNWNSGDHINYSNDNNITKDILGGGGFYDITLSGTNSILITNNITNTGIGSEVEFDYFSENSIVFLNAVDYDTKGQVTSFKINNFGTNYNSGLFNTSGGSGNGLTINTISNTIGQVKSIDFSTSQDFTYDTTNNGDIRETENTSNSLASGLKVKIVINPTNGTLGNVISVIPEINDLGQNYQINDIIKIKHENISSGSEDGTGATFSIANILKGEILLSSTQSNQGFGYSLGDTIIINQGDNNAEIEVTGVAGSLTRLTDAYKVIKRTLSSSSQTLELSPIIPFNNLFFGGKFYTDKASNKYNYLHKTKFNKSRISSGIFKRAYITHSLLKDETFDVSDKDFKNIPKLKKLIFVDTIFSNTKNILSKATYMNSFFVGGNDNWDNGIFYDSIWNNGNFTNGLFKESIWINGTFSNGLFYNCKSFNNGTFSNYDQDVKTRYYKKGNTANSRFSWQSGTFLNGEFFKSDWENGTFNNGKFYYSKFYNGVFNNGNIGDKSIPIEDTWFYNGTINYANVENSKIVSEKYNGITFSQITWNDGIFNSGVFETNDNQSVTNSATWNNGIFNSGIFSNSAKWKDGEFNNGKFISYFGWTQSDILSNQGNKLFYSWEKGIFNGGEFGNASLGTNSTWFDGEFNNGQFKGRVWNNGIFLSGEFLGSGAIAIGGPLSIATASNPGLFVNSYQNQYYGLWRNGYVTDIKDKYIKDKKLYTTIKRASNTIKVVNKASLKNMLWLNGTFYHPNGEISNSVWLDGIFESGKFLSSSFNPYTLRNNIPTFNFEKTCLWKNGIFESGEFSISVWENGEFNSGTAIGMNWQNGTVNYMNAYNVLWENGLWRNGNWNGSYFELNKNGSLTDKYTLQILQNGMSASGTSSLHVWNVFYNESLSNYNQSLSKATDFQYLQGTNNNVELPEWSQVSNFRTQIAINWDGQFFAGTQDQIGSSVDMRILLISNYNELIDAKWQLSNDNINWTTYSNVTTTENLYVGISGVNYFRIKDIIDNSEIYSNVLKYTQSNEEIIPSENITRIDFTSETVNNPNDGFIIDLNSNIIKMDTKEFTPSTNYIRQMAVIVNATNFVTYKVYLYKNNQLIETIEKTANASNQSTLIYDERANTTQFYSSQVGGVVKQVPGSSDEYSFAISSSGTTNYQWSVYLTLYIYNTSLVSTDISTVQQVQKTLTS